MLSRSQTISKLVSEKAARESYIRAKLNHLIPSQIKALRLRKKWTQKQLGEESDMKQARISAMEKPGEVSFAIDTLIRVAAAYKVALQVSFVPFSEMLGWDNNYSQDEFAVTPIDKDEEFLSPASSKEIRLTGNVFVLPVNASITDSKNYSYMSIDPPAPKTERGALCAFVNLKESERRLTA